MSKTSHEDVCGGAIGLNLISTEMEKVRGLLIGLLTSRAKAQEVERLLNYVGRRGGKMLRPALVLLSGLATGGELVKEHVEAGAIVEMIHTATLLHDDVIDEGQTRRGMPTVNSMWGNEPAVLLGDYLLSRAFQMCAYLEREPAQIIAEATTQVCEGELRQVTQKHNWDLSEDMYVEIITDKSASLFAGSCRVGAYLAGAEGSMIERLTGFGLSVGVAFQITDDLLDLTGDESRAGKTLGADIDNDKPTLSVIHLLSCSDDEQKETIRAMIDSGHGRDELVRMLRSAGSLDYATNKAREYVEKAIGVLKHFPLSPAREALEALARHVVERTR